jgi:uncharacterized protein (DUF427 family)
MQTEQERRFWQTVPRQRPREIVPPGPGEESVWDYPRPPRLETVSRHIRVEHADRLVARSAKALRVCETAGPPVYYTPPAGVHREWLEPAPLRTSCEWKGEAHYWHLRFDDTFVENVAWSYPAPFPGYEGLRDHLAFFAGRVDACFVGDARVVPQPGGFYGGWITPEIVGPFKGEPGSEGW